MYSLDIDENIDDDERSSTSKCYQSKWVDPRQQQLTQARYQMTQAKTHIQGLELHIVLIADPILHIYSVEFSTSVISSLYLTDTYTLMHCILSDQ